MTGGSGRARATAQQGDRRSAVVVRASTIALAAALTLPLATGPANAMPPPPPNPSNSDLRSAQAQADAKAGQVGQLTNQLTAAQAALQSLQDQVELKQENANKALVDLQTAQDAATRAKTAASAAQVSADAAGNAIEQLRAQVDQFAAGSFEQGSELGSVSAYFGAKSPKDLLERQQLLDAISGSELDVLSRMQQARTAKANADSLARAALVAAQGKQADAEAAKRVADAAIAAAVSAQQAQAAQTSRLQTTEASVQQQLTAAQGLVGNLRSQRAQYDNWLAAKQAEDARIAAEAAANSRPRGGGGGGGPIPAVRSLGAVGAVLHRALSAIGITYAWGGGTADGPSLGIHDGGVADSYGDYNKIGFDCSGLMVYAFAAAGVSLPHFSGYQYTAGPHVPLSDIQPGDLLFWSSDGAQDGIHHVALYIGGGQMVEAYESGTTIRVTSVRYYGGIMPFATRLL